MTTSLTNAQAALLAASAVWSGTGGRSRALEDAETFVVWLEARDDGSQALSAQPPTPSVCTDPDCTIPRKPGRPMHGPHDFRARG